MSITRRSTLLMTLFAMAPAVRAHDDAALDTVPAPHGGQLRMAGIYHYELVIAPAAGEGKISPVTVYVTDHAGAAVTTAGATGTATVLGGTKKASIALKPGAGNVMKGDGVYVSSPDMKVIVSIALPGKVAEVARFTPLSRPSNPMRDARR